MRFTAAVESCLVLGVKRYTFGIKVHNKEQLRFLNLSFLLPRTSHHVHVYSPLLEIQQCRSLVAIHCRYLLPYIFVGL